MNVMFPS